LLITTLFNFIMLFVDF